MPFSLQIVDILVANALSSREALLSSDYRLWISLGLPVGLMMQVGITLLIFESRDLVMDCNSPSVSNSFHIACLTICYAT